MVVGAAAIVAPVLHSVTDVMEWYQGGFSTPQLWLNYLAFLPMCWLLLGVYVIQQKRLGYAALVGALLYSVSFAYFTHSTLYALALHVADYETLWRGLGTTYTVHGGFMVVGGLLFAWEAYRASNLPRIAVLLFAGGLLLNLVLTGLPTPDLMQTLGTGLRNAGLVGMGHAILFRRTPDGA
ncbi:hypothetical protein DLREEDagrD3_10920 [Denitratisoma sp. agr-D3]